MLERVCSKCNQAKSIENYSWQNKTKRVMRAQCKDCDRIDARNLYLRTREGIISRQDNRHAHRFENGICKMCSEQRLENSVLCEYHFCRNAANRVKKSAGHEGGVFLMKMLEEQDYKCPYTGRDLVLGVNCYIDHIMPVAHFPELESDLTNLMWVDKDVNQVKRDKTPQEFLEFCKMIVSNRG